MNLIDYCNEEKIVIESGSTSIGEIIKAVSIFINMENVKEIRLFGSCIQPPKEKIIDGDCGFFGLFSTPSKKINIYPKDIDVLILTKTIKTPFKCNLRVEGKYIDYGESMGYGYSYMTNGVIKDKVHALVVPQIEWDRNIDSNDPTTISINNNCRTIYKEILCRN